MKHFTCKPELQLHSHYNSTHVRENNEGRQNGEGSLLVIEKGELTIWLISVIGMGEIVLSEPWGRDEALGVGDTPGEAGWTLMTLSFDVRFGDNLAGKLRVFVHWDRLRTMVATVLAYTTLVHWTLLSLRRSDAYALRGGWRTNAGRINFAS